VLAEDEGLQSRCEQQESEGEQRKQFMSACLKKISAQICLGRDAPFLKRMDSELYHEN
jgi:psiF repeat